MAYSCAATGTQYLRTTPEVLTGYPFTLNCWGYIVTTGAQRNFILLHNVTNAYRHAVFINASSQATLVSVDSGGTTQTTITAATISANTWFMLTGVFTSATSRTVYLNAANATTGTTSRTPTTPTRMLLGGQYTGSTTSNLNGRIAEVGIWDAALTADEITSLYRGAKPIGIRPQNLQNYYPLVRGITNYTGTHTVNDDGGTKGADHYRRYG